MLFSAFLEAQEDGAAVLALEEPEAHLHPSAIRALWTLVRDFTGQKLISTHSGEFLADTDICDVRRLARTGDGIKAFRVPSGASDAGREAEIRLPRPPEPRCTALRPLLAAR